MLSERLKAIADLIEYGETMADIGTDHGFLPVYLVQSGKSPYAIATDISENSLKKAEKLILSEAFSDMCSTRIGNGIEPIKIGEVDDVVIAGMGGILMTEILSADIIKAHSFKKIILQPRSKIAYLRKWIRENDFLVVKEAIVKEGNRFCEILLVGTSGNSLLDNDESCEVLKLENEKILGDGCLLTDYFPETLIEKPNELTLEYLRYHLMKNEAILSNLKNNMSKKSEDFCNSNKLNDFEAIVKHLRRLIYKYEETVLNDANKRSF